MRVGVVAPRHPPSVGGGFTFHVAVLEALGRASTRHEFVLLDLSGKDPGDWAGSGLPLIDVQAMFPSYAFSGNAAPITDLAAAKLVLDVVWYLDPPAEALSVPVFATVLDLGHRQHPFFPEVSIEDWDWDARENNYRSALPRATRIFTGTPTGKEQIIRCYGVNPANIIVNPFPTPVFARSDKALGDDEVLSKHGLSPGFLFYPAQFWPHKNHVNLLLALKQLETVHGLSPDLVLTGTDKGNLLHVLQVAEDLGLRQRVHYLGFVSNGDVATLYRCAAALVFPSFLGPDNLPPLEAFSLGCPVLAGHIEGVEEQLGSATAEPRIEKVPGRFRSLGKLLLAAFKRSPPERHPDDSESGFAGYFDPARPEDIAAVMARVLRDAAFRARLIKHGQALAAGRTPDAYVQAVVHALDEFEPWRRNWPKAGSNCPSLVSEFPADLANKSLFHAGIYDDGWLAWHSSLFLRAPSGSSLLRVRGEVPRIDDSDFSTVLTISVEGKPLAYPALGTGSFDISLKVPEWQDCYRIELAFGKSQCLPEPDGRVVGAKLDFIGFSDDVAANSTVPQ